jgi:hypothetical protein
MREQGASYPLTQASLGGKRLGPGTALVDEDVLRVLLSDAPDGEKALQIRYETILGVGMSDGSVVVTCRDGRGFVVKTAEAASFRQGILAACRALPEVTRTLRALGSRRGARGTRRNPTDKEGRFFFPFIAARRASMEARDAANVVRSFDAERLASLVAGAIDQFARELGAGHPARQRAVEAELTDAVESLSHTLDELKRLAANAAADVDDLGRWRAWAAGVQQVFEAADKAWVEIEPIVSRR